MGEVHILPRPRKYDSREAIMDLVRYHMHDYDIKDISEVTGISKSALMRIRRGQTIWPRPHTMFTLLPAIGLRMIVEKKVK